MDSAMTEMRKLKRVLGSRMEHLKENQLMNMEMKMTLEMTRSKLNKKISSRKISKI